MSRKSHTPPANHQVSKLVKHVRKYLWWVFIALLVYMPLHIFLAQSLSLITGGLEIWKVAKDAAIVTAASSAAFLLWPLVIDGKSQKLRLLASFILGYGLTHLLFLLFVDLDPESSLLASLYNNRLTMLLVIGLAVGIYSKNKPKNTNLLMKVLIGISGLVAALGVIQFFLPQDFLADFGYSIERGVRAFFAIDNKPDLPRIMSTIRDPNSLGAYLLVTSTLLAALYIKLRKSARQMLVWSVVLLPIQIVAIALTFSRSAWLGVVVSFAFLIWHVPKFRRYFKPRNLALALVFITLITLAAYPTIRNSYVAENVILHSDETTTDVGSSEKHFNYIKEGIKDVVRQPIGHGPGTAGIVSIRNERGTVLVENYYVQIAYEVGVMGLALFIAINYLVYDFLRKSPENALRLALLASFWGVVVTNMLLHTWSNEAVAVVWWMIAGYQIGLSKILK